MQAEAAQKVGRDRLFAAAALARRLRGFGMQSFAFPHQRVVHGAVEPPLREGTAAFRP